jgi:dipeptidyl aminopeptidase/acylaminoacyl peptidase
MILIGLAIVAGAPARPAPLDVYGRLPSLGFLQISPDGAMLASVVTDGEKRHLVIETTDKRQRTIDLNFGEVKVRALQWAGPDHVIASFSRTGNLNGLIGTRHEFLQALDVDWKRRTYRPLLYGVPDALNVIYGLPEVRILNGRPFAFVQGSMVLRNGSPLTLFRIDMQAGAAMPQTVGYLDTTDFVVDAQGNTLAQAEFDDRASRWSLDVWKGQWTAAADLRTPIGSPQVVGLGRDGTSIAVASGAEEDGFFVELKGDGSAWSDRVPAPDPDGLIWDGATHKLIGEGHLDGDQQRYHFFAPADQTAWDKVVSQFPGAQLRLESFTDDHRRFVVHVDGPASPPAYFLSDIGAASQVSLGAEYKGLDTGDVAKVDPITFKASDGLSIGGYLTEPNGAPAAKLPLVVLVHGGPAARDEPGFDWWAQGLASRGYGVLQVNYRGSAGLGAKLFTAGFGQWGRKMQTDLSDGVRALVARGIVDPGRVCIVGASYGGYAALAGATIDTGVYRCAASIAGPSDLPAMLAAVNKTDEARAGSMRRYWLRYMGAGDLDAISPAKLAAKVSIPILLIHGKDDTVVPYDQSRIMASALQKAGKDVTFVTLNREDHWLSQGATRLLMLQSVVEFLERADPPGPQADGESPPPAE